MGSMKVIGGSGFIGRHLVAALLTAGRDVEAPSHRDFDIAREEPGWLAGKLNCAEVVINCAGLARDARVDNLNAVNSEGPRRLALACKLAGVRRLVHVSSLGADPLDDVRFQRAKGEAEAELAKIEGLEVVIVRPSLVMGPGGASGDFFAALAAMPLPPRLGEGRWRVQPIHVSELVELLIKLADSPTPPARVDAVGPAALSTDELTEVLREWLGQPVRPRIPLPRPVLGLAAWANEIVEFGPGDRDFVRLLERENHADSAGVSAVLGRAPLSLAASLARQPASLGDYWRARLYFLQPLLRLTLAALWIGTGVVSFGLFPPAEFYVMLGELGLTGPLAEVGLFGVAAVNLALGCLLLVNWRPPRVAVAMVCLLVAFSVAALMLPHEYWLTPFAPILKNLPIGVALLTLIGMEPPRRARKTREAVASAPMARPAAVTSVS